MLAAGHIVSKINGGDGLLFVFDFLETRPGSLGESTFGRWEEAEPCLRLSCEALLVSFSWSSGSVGGAREGDGIGIGAGDGYVACA